MTLSCPLVEIVVSATGKLGGRAAPADGPQGADTGRFTRRRDIFIRFLVPPERSGAADPVRLRTGFSAMPGA
jgi:hypothetical protein